MNGRCIENSTNFKGSRNLFCNVVWPNVTISQIWQSGSPRLLSYKHAALLLSILGLIGPYGSLTANESYNVNRNETSRSNWIIVTKMDEDFRMQICDISLKRRVAFNKATLPRTMEDVQFFCSALLLLKFVTVDIEISFHSTTA